MSEMVFNLNHCAIYIKGKMSFHLTEEQIMEILELETDYMDEYGYTE